jgi:hypothetical protein
MSVTLVCPSCNAVLTFHRPPVGECGNCNAAIDPAIRARLEAELQYSESRRPMLIQVGAIGASLSGGVCLLFLLLAPFNIGIYRIDRETVTGPEFLRRQGLLFGANAIVLLLIAFGILSEKWWARHLMLFFWCMTAAVTLTSYIRDSGYRFAGSVVAVLVALAIAAWYLYGKENVVQYYRVLEQRKLAR